MSKQIEQTNQVSAEDIPKPMGTEVGRLKASISVVDSPAASICHHNKIFTTLKSAFCGTMSQT